MFESLTKVCLRMAKMRFNTSCVHNLKYTAKENSGIYRRLKRISEDEPDIDNAGINYDSIEDLEQDFMQAGDMNDEILDEMKRISKRRQFKITERRHFRPPKEPSMLTWAEKEQIRHLNQNNPENWTAEVLAESFPATPPIIRKILKVKWKPASPERLKEHDQQVSDNWKAFFKGQLEVHNLSLKAHLQKFTDRKDGVRIVSDEEAAKVTEIIIPKPQRTDFSSIITSFKPSQELQQLDIKKRTFETKPIGNCNVNYTLDQYCKKLKHEVTMLPEDSTHNINALISRNKKQEETKCSQSSNTYVAPSESFKENAVVYRISKKSPLTLKDPDNLPNRIKIPKEVWQEGSLYRVDDCFYSDKGYFLYKVPGLKQK